MIANVLEYLENSEKAAPRKVAFADEVNSLTYEQLIRASKNIGSFLSQSNQIRKPVVIYMTKNVYQISAMMGVVYSGNFYVPVDVSLPAKRVNLILDILSPQTVLTDNENYQAACDLDFPCEIINYITASNTVANEEKLADIRRNSISTDPLYAIFTSGSTGVPKGVCVSHRSVINLVEQFTQTFGFSDLEIFGNQAPFDFDVSVKDIYFTLKNTAAMVIIPKVFFSFPQKLIDFLNKRKVTAVIWATSVMRIIANLKALKNDYPHTLKKIMFSGEIMPNKVLNYWREHIPKAMYVNLYGPTEITCNCTYYIVDRPFEDTDPLPIGTAFRNTDIMLINERNELCAHGEEGEICVRGTCLALGYYNSPQITSAAFCQNPVNTHYPELIYRTGDIGYYNNENLLMFTGRRDSQIKHMGHRIELGEIDAAVNSLPFIEAARCFYDLRKEHIVLFYQADKDCAKEILISLKGIIPKYMNPNKLIHYVSLPLNKNMKININLLKENYYNE